MRRFAPMLGLGLGLTLPMLTHAAAAAGTAPEWRALAPAQAIAPPCLSLSMTRDVSVLIPEAIITDLIAERPNDWGTPGERTEAKRLAYLWGSRAQLIHRLKSTQTDARGCQLVAERNLGEAQFLIARLLDEGQAAVAVAGQEQLARELTVAASSCQNAPIGSRSYRLGHDLPFLFLITCVT